MGAWTFILTNINSLYPEMLCAKFGWNLSSGSEEIVEIVKSLHRGWRIDGRRTKSDKKSSLKCKLKRYRLLNYGKCRNFTNYRKLEDIDLIFVKYVYITNTVLTECAKNMRLSRKSLFISLFCVIIMTVRSKRIEVKKILKIRKIDAPCNFGLNRCCVCKIFLFYIILI